MTGVRLLASIRRTLTGATAGALALLGVVLGIVGAYVVLLGAYLGNLSDLRQVPIGHLAVIGIGVPVLATASRWLLAGRQPPARARYAID